MHDLPRLSSFIAIADAGKLSIAAERLHLTVSALSHQMRELESRVGCTLLRRHARGVELTVEGRQLYEAVAPPLQALQQAMRAWRRRDAGQLRLSAMPSFVGGWLVPRLSGFVAEHPEVSISLESSVDLVDFATQPMDAAIRFGAGQWPGLHAIRLFDESITPAAAPALIARMGAAPWSLWPRLGDPRDRWKDWQQAFGALPAAPLQARFDDVDALHRATLAGLGVALVRVSLARSLLADGRLVQLDPRWLPAGASHYLVYPERSRLLPGVQAFEAWIVREAERFGRAHGPRQE